MQTSDDVAKIAGALIKVQAAIANPKATDSAQGERGTYRYATLDRILDQVRPLLARHGVVLLQTAARGERGVVVVTTRLLHRSGQWIEDTVSALPGNAGPQAVGSVITYLRRYSICAMLAIAAEEDDDGSAADSRPNDAEASGHAPSPAAADKAPVAPPAEDKHAAWWARFWTSDSYNLSDAKIRGNAFACAFEEGVKRAPGRLHLDKLYADNEQDLARQDKPVYDRLTGLAQGRAADLGG